MLQLLEQRRLLSGVTTSLNSGLLTVTGTSHADDIHIDILDNGVTVKDAGVVIFSTPIMSTDVFAGIVVKARAGNDTVSVNSNESTFRTTVWGNSGKDTLTLLSFHGPGGVVHGGPGNDTITTDTEITGSSVGAEVFGGSGNDKITATHGGGGAPSKVVGGSGNDDITVNALVGLGVGPAGDTVQGGSGNDVIHGSPLDDLLDGGPGKDNIDGAAGNDTAVNSKQDSFTNVENFV